MRLQASPPRWLGSGKLGKSPAFLLPSKSAMSLESRSSRIDGLAIFAATAFALGVAAIMALDRIGAPAGLVRAIGPVLTLIGVTVFGLGARNADLGSFIAASRRISPFYGGLSGVAVAAGVALCLYPD